MAAESPTPSPSSRAPASTAARPWPSCHSPHHRTAVRAHRPFVARAHLVNRKLDRRPIQHQPRNIHRLPSLVGDDEYLPTPTLIALRNPQHQPADDRSVCSVPCQSPRNIPTRMHLTRRCSRSRRSLSPASRTQTKIPATHRNQQQPLQATRTNSWIMHRTMPFIKIGSIHSIRKQANECSMKIRRQSPKSHPYQAVF